MITDAMKEIQGWRMPAQQRSSLRVLGQATVRLALIDTACSLNMVAQHITRDPANAFLSLILSQTPKEVMCVCVSALLKSSLLHREATSSIFLPHC